MLGIRLYQNVSHMKKYQIATSLLMGMVAFSACDNDTNTVTTSDTTTQMTQPATIAAEGTASGRYALSETDTYMDLNTQKTFTLRHDSQSGYYTASDMTPLNIYVNTTTRDTFSGPEGLLVNNALVFTNGAYSIDELKVKRNGEGYKVKSEDGEYKEKLNENEYKLKDGDVKVKANENEYKYKDKSAGVKIKSNENETKIKTPDEKIKIDDKGNVERKPR